jgi:HEAT repeats
LAGDVTTSFTDFPLERALKQLFGPDANFIFLYPNQRASPMVVVPPAEVRILGREGNEAPGSASRRQRLTEQAAIPVPTPEAPVPEPNLDIEREFDRHPHLAYEAALSAPDIEQRLRAIAYLGQQSTPEAVSVLLEVVHEDDPHVRRIAVEVVGPLAGSDPQIRQALVQVLQTAAEAELRQLVTDVLGDLLEPAPEGGTAGRDPADR